MFERFTESARRALFFARYEVTKLGATTIEPHHILLGLIRESKGLLGGIFQRANVSPETVRQQIEAKTEFREPIPASQEVPFSPQTLRVLQFATEEADRFQHGYIGTEHLLLGVLREEHAMGASILNAQGLRLEDARNTIGVLLKETPTVSEASTGAELERLALIKRLVEDLARLASDSDKARPLLQQIERNLDVLARHLRR
jgi:ATP-dependent Clp protease ATP-binding subunit ClpC